MQTELAKINRTAVIIGRCTSSFMALGSLFFLVIMFIMSEKVKDYIEVPCEVISSESHIESKRIGNSIQSETLYDITIRYTFNNEEYIVQLNDNIYDYHLDSILINPETNEIEVKSHKNYIILMIIFAVMFVVIWGITIALFIYKI